MEKGQFSNEVKVRRGEFEKRYQKENFEKDIMHLIETNQQINMAFEHSVSSNTSFKKHLNAKSFKMFWE